MTRLDIVVKFAVISVAGSGPRLVMVVTLSTLKNSTSPAVTVLVQPVSVLSV